jgi:hypothetical protein
MPKFQALYNSLCGLSIGSIIKVKFKDTTELYIVNDKKNFIKLEMVDYGILMNNEQSLNDFCNYLIDKNVNNIAQLVGEELSKVKTLLIELLFCVSQYEINSIYEKDVKEKVNKLKELLY